MWWLMWDTLLFSPAMKQAVSSLQVRLHSSIIAAEIMGLTQATVF